jgi:hypothetical protein
MRSRAAIRNIATAKGINDVFADETMPNITFTATVAAASDTALSFALDHRDFISGAFDAV